MFPLNSESVKSCQCADRSVSLLFDSLHLLQPSPLGSLPKCFGPDIVVVWTSVQRSPPRHWGERNWPPQAAVANRSAAPDTRVPEGTGAGRSGFISFISFISGLRKTCSPSVTASLLKRGEWRALLSARCVWEPSSSLSLNWVLANTVNKSYL